MTREDIEKNMHEAAEEIKPLVTTLVEALCDAHQKGYLAGVELGAKMAYPQWIPVEERKPQERGHYLVYSQFGDVWLSEWMQDKEGRWDWYVAPICVGIISKVTHWMPLPAAPRKED